MKNMNFERNFLYAAAFIEGSALMSVEILSSKIIAPWYGASLYVWAAIIGITMGGLAIGYYLGGIWSEKRIHTVNRLMFLFVIASLFLLFMPLLAEWIMQRTLSLDIRAGIFFSCMVFMLPLFICFGMVSPVIIRLVGTRAERVGYSAGLVYTISTLGGILFTFLTGFYLVSALGVKQSTQVTALFVMLPPLVAACYYVLAKNKKKLADES